MKKAIGGGEPGQGMASGTSPSFEQLDQALRQLGGGGGAPEAHGQLCGLACFLGTGAGTVWIAELLGPGPASGAVEQPAAGALGHLVKDTFAALSGTEIAFQPLLPPDDRPLSLRAQGLAEWCAGFMHGLGEAAGNTASREALSGEVTREIMADFGEIARLTLGEEDADLEAEAAYTELVEFVRVSVQLMFEELYDVRRRLAAASVH
jgi:hypothetical protein